MRTPVDLARHHLPAMARIETWAHPAAHERLDPRPMQDLVLDSGVIRYGGIQDVEVTDNGLALHRMPAWTRPQIVDPGLQLV